MKQLLIFTTIKDLSIELFSTQKIKEMIDIEVILYTESKKNIIAALKKQPDFIYLRDPFTDKNLHIPEIKEKVELIFKEKGTSLVLDGAKNVTDVFFEDKWIQYKQFGEFMPKTILIENFSEESGKWMFKKRISSRAKAVFFEHYEIQNETDFIAQERLDIKNEYRVFAISGKVISQVGVKTPKTEDQKVKLVGTCEIPKGILSFVEKINEKLDFNLTGFDVVKTTDDKYKLIEINKSPQFNTYSSRTKINLAEVLVDGLLKK